jgi:hypothetical protein
MTGHWFDRLMRPGVLLSRGGTLADKLAEDAPLRDAARNRRAEGQPR